MPFMQWSDRMIVALDRSSRDEILRLADALHGVAGVLKIGLQAFVANGPALVREIAGRGERVFLDLKVHDIPNTAQHAIREAESLGAFIATVHAAGGRAMLEACGGTSVMVAGVTVLTSLDDDELHRIGFAGSSIDNAVRLAKLVKDAGLPAIVASPHEIAPIRDACGAGLRIITPGIRPAGSDRGDQRRTMTPAEAVRAGADYIVVGRPITDASDVRAAAMAILDAMTP